MGSQLVTSVVTVATAIIGLAIVAVLVSNNAQTGNLLTAGGNAFSGVLRAAEGPVAGGFGSLGNGFPGGGGSYLG